MSIINRHLSNESDHGLTLSYYNKIQTMLLQRIPYARTITRNIVDRAIYLYGFSYEQSERLVHLINRLKLPLFKNYSQLITLTEHRGNG